jgi:outer membrane PBP1 activator LpoA protein
VVQGIGREEVISGQQIESESPWELALRADSAPTDVAIELRLAAIDGFLGLQEFTSAETQANYLLDVFLDQAQSNRLGFQRGLIALGFGQYQTAVQYLQPLRNDPLWNPAERARLLRALADAQIGLDRRVDAITSLFLRDRLLSGEEQVQNQRRIMDLLQGASSLEQALLRQSANNNALQANLVDGWLAFTGLGNLSEVDRTPAFLRWRNSYAGHPARGELLGTESAISLDRFNHIALLLPFTSPFGNAATAFHDGFMDAYNADTSISRPAISLHDIGETPALASFYYQSAMIEGADFVIGPLGREAAAALLQGGPLSTPTVLLADIPAESVSPGLYGISLSPEAEAGQVAARAFRDGHRQAAIFRSDSGWGDRAASAFMNAWTELGGRVVSNRSFPDTIEDHSRIIQRFLEVNQSVARRKVLSAQLGLNLEFTPRRRDDIDMLFFAGNARQARLLVPQLRFFQAHDLPIYATSNVFTGAVNPAVDADLDNLVFGDMRWMVDIRYEIPQEEQTGATPDSSTDPARALDGESDDPVADAADGVDSPEPPPAPEPEPVAKSPYSFTPLDRLYALGLETYHLVPRLAALRRDDWQRYNGQAFRASVGQDGNVLRHLEWATFTRGRVTLIDTADTPVPPGIDLPQPGAGLTGPSATQ